MRWSLGVVLIVGLLGAFWYSKTVSQPDAIRRDTTSNPADTPVVTSTATDPTTAFPANQSTTSATSAQAAKMKKSNDEWRKQLSEEQFRVTRERGTERAFTGIYWNTKTSGTYHCICCDAPLFSSTTKFDSGCGWPSFFLPNEERLVTELPDNSHGMQRTEVICSQCDAHLGHVFNDGPAPTGLRYCINSASLQLKPSEPASSDKPDSVPQNKPDSNSP